MLALMLLPIYVLAIIAATQGQYEPIIGMAAGTPFLAWIIWIEYS
jgi:hypothetical protein